MQIDDFKSIVTTFSDPGTEILFERSKIVISVNGDLIEAAITLKTGDVFVDEDNGVQQPGSHWILNRLAKLPLLATRLQESVIETEYFVSPVASLSPSLEINPNDTPICTQDALEDTLVALENRSPLETTVLYVTSDAGEGKTTLINQVTREQAARFVKKKSDWLLVPIPLGGRHFLRFDDITVGVLQNRYRFPFLYYHSFLALVKMGVIVPAFDGFEEMFVESSSGEALSAMGLLLGLLDSKGAVVIAARKAYFEFENLKSQERLYDSITKYGVGFGKLELQRWEKKQFLAYCTKRSVSDATTIYEKVKERLALDHPLLTRPVLVRRLVDIASTSPSLEDFLSKIHASGPDFFNVFVRGIIKREAEEKWIDLHAEVRSPLLTVDEHYELLSQIALGMWETHVGYLKRDYLEFVADYFCETKRKTAFQTQQIRERIRGHALLVNSPNASDAVEFDHEEFRLFFLGEGIAEQTKPLDDRAKGTVYSLLRKGPLPKHAQEAFILAIKRDSQLECFQVASLILNISLLDGQASYTQENCNGLLLGLLTKTTGNNLEIANLVFGENSLRDRELSDLYFNGCYFATTSLEMSKIANCVFTKCKFGQLNIYNTTSFSQVRLEDCTIDSIRLVEKEIGIWNPNRVQVFLEKLGISFEQEQFEEITTEQLINANPDPELENVMKLVRYFMRSTTISESVILMKLGNQAQGFLGDAIPELIENGVLLEIGNHGSSNQRRFKLGLHLQKLNEAISSAEGSYSKFLEICSGRAK